MILSYLQGFSDYTSLLVHIMIEDEFIQEKKPAIIKNSKEEIHQWSNSQDRDY